MNFLTVKSKLLFMVVSLGLIMTIGIGYVGYTIGKAAITKVEFQQLTSLRAAKTFQVESYFDTTIKNFKLFVTEYETPKMMQRFEDAFDTYDVPEDLDIASLENFYTTQYFPELASAIETPPVFERYAPEKTVGRALQVAYTVAADAPFGEKAFLRRGEGPQAYHDVHQRYHAQLERIAEERGYEDLFLIDKDGDIVYSVYKETDFAANVTIGILARSNLNAAFRRASNIGNGGSVVVEDFAPYPPSFYDPAMWMAAPVYNDEGLYLGVIAVQLPVDMLEEVMTGGRKWREQGLGESGETYLVGADRTLRSSSRFLIEDKAAYLAKLRQIGMSAAAIEKIDRTDQSILLQPVDTDAVQSVFTGETGTDIIDDYRGVPVLSSYGLVNAGGLRWAILAEMDEAEALEPIARFARLMLMAITSAALLLAFLALWFSGLILRPVEQLAGAAQKLAAGARGVRVDDKGVDEFADLGRSFNEMATELESRADRMESQSHAYETMLRSVFPAMIAKRLEAGDRVIAETHDDVTVIIAIIEGMDALMIDRSAADTLRLLNDLIGDFDAAGERMGVEKVKTLGEIYVAVCSLSGHRIDHVRRAINAAKEFARIVDQFEERHGLTLSLKVGLASGEIDGGVVGTQRLVYDVWGQPVVVARRLADLASNGHIRMTKASAAQVKGIAKKHLKPAPELQIGAEGGVSEAIVEMQLDIDLPGTP